MITKYQELYQKRFGRAISRNKALENGLKLVRMLNLVYRPMPKNEYKKLQNQKRQPMNP